MLLQDRIYGKVTIEEPVLIDLLHSSTLERLKHISQFGVPDKYYNKKNYSRYEHSVGVMILLKKLGGTLTEQIAGLLHDVSHTAFSHVVDWVLESGEQEDYQDNTHKKFVHTTDIPAILREHTVLLKSVISYHNYPLIDTDIPDLCADRVDYSLREFPSHIAQKCLEGFTIYKNTISCKTIETAKLFAINYLTLQQKHWGGFEAASRFRLFADALRIALKDKISPLKNIHYY